MSSHPDGLAGDGGADAVELASDDAQIVAVDAGGDPAEILVDGDFHATRANRRGVARDAPLGRVPIPVPRALLGDDELALLRRWHDHGHRLRVVVHCDDDGAPAWTLRSATLTCDDDQASLTVRTRRRDDPDPSSASPPPG